MGRSISAGIYRNCDRLRFSLLVILSLSLTAFGQSSNNSAAALITQPIDDGNLVELKGNVYPAARASVDQGVADGSLALSRMILILRRSPAQELELQKYLDDQKNPKATAYHHWLTPQQFGERFGSNGHDVATITQWLRSHGFTIDSVAKGNNVILFSGTHAQLSAAFHTSLHQYKVNGKLQIANATNPQIPAALALAVVGIAKLNDFPLMPMHANFGGVTRHKGDAKWRPSKGAPQFNTKISGSDFFAVGPADFAEIYNVKPLWDAGIDGTGQNIAIAGRSDINPADVDAFRSYFGLPAKKLNVIYNGGNPGFQFGDEGESDLDIEWSGAIAKNATINFVASASTTTSDGVELSAQYIIDNALAPVMSLSYGECEVGLGDAGNALINELWRQAAAEGITVMVSAGDAGSAACDQGQPFAGYGIAVNGLGSTPYNVAVGGTDLYGTYLNASNYWNATNDPTSKQSAKSYMPELPWNNSCGNPQLLAAYQSLGYPDKTTEDLCNDVDLAPYVANVVGGGGGASACTNSSGGDPTTCTDGYTKPAWQSGVPGIPADTVRDIPDVSLFAGSGLWGSFYVFCESDVTPDLACNLDSGDDVQMLAAGGTSFASPAFAGVMALVNQKTNSSQGNANYDLYKLAGKQYSGSGAAACDTSAATTVNACTFYDVSLGSNAMPCASGTLDCTLNDSSHFLGVLPSYSSNAGYDLTSGLGTINAFNLVDSWSDATTTFSSSTTTLTLDSNSIAYGSTLTGSIAVGASSGGATPSGDASLITAAGTTGVGFGPFALRNGDAAFSVTGTAPGTYSVTAHYAGDATFAPSSSDPTSITIAKASTSATLNASKAAISAGESVTFQVMLATSSKAMNPTGTVTFTDSTTGATLGTTSVHADTDASGYSIGRAAINVDGKALNQGANSVVADYSGDGNYNASSASAVSVTYTPPFTLASTASVVTVTSGSSATAALSLTANGGPFPADITLSCPSPTPAGISCSFSPATLGAGSSTASSTLTVNAVFPATNGTHRSAPAHKANLHLELISGTGAAFAVVFLCLPVGRKPRLASLIVFMAFCLVTFGCGNDSHSPAASTTTLSATPTAGGYGSTFTFKATVSGQGAGGTVTFIDGSSQLGTASVSNGTATFTTTTLAYGQHSAVAQYGGDAHNLPSSSAAASVDVQYQTTLAVRASDSLGNTTTIQIPITVQ
ncbi:peptidase S8 and S53, subtilisin, kexin, sedolisin [Candidatus Koribacter versatilis Ellin345]|uniref:Peptidase S8 and S53, subtilisin, kexin, sedolisin n=1 Tax=Koribacter versatilis (strain Ellin345) TaxID=204669 RepID=Q1IUI6_KORVE|nr:Ig-like domain repeat protein [Candidatus Koribacter versatilis]ABF39464.1 peptidase S8 and S53, subtilisin, kexin, sedolisin [Candidatus Koribacter versatilis Ellin345]